MSQTEKLSARMKQSAAFDTPHFIRNVVSGWATEAEAMGNEIAELRRDRESFAESGKGLLALAEKMFRLLEESAKRGFARMKPEGVTFEDLTYVKRMRAALAKAEGAATPVQRETNTASGIEAAMQAEQAKEGGNG